APFLRHRAAVRIRRRRPAPRAARCARRPGDLMTARIIDGKAIAQQYRAEFALRVERLKERGIVPGLAVVIVGSDPASQVYVRNKALASGAIGMHSEVHALSADTLQSHLIAFVKSLKDRKSTRLNSSHVAISYAVSC